MFDIKHTPKPEIFITEGDRKTLQQLAFAALEIMIHQAFDEMGYESHRK